MLFLDPIFLTPYHCNQQKFSDLLAEPAQLPPPCRTNLPHPNQTQREGRTPVHGLRAAFCLQRWRPSVYLPSVSMLRADGLLFETDRLRRVRSWAAPTRLRAGRATTQASSRRGAQWEAVGRRDKVSGEDSSTAGVKYLLPSFCPGSQSSMHRSKGRALLVRWVLRGQPTLLFTLTLTHAVSTGTLRSPGYVWRYALNQRIYSCRYRGGVWLTLPLGLVLCSPWGTQMTTGNRAVTQTGTSPQQAD